jgi:hypothetical protein
MYAIARQWQQLKFAYNCVTCTFLIGASGNIACAAAAASGEAFRTLQIQALLVI